MKSAVVCFRKRPWMPIRTKAYGNFPLSVIPVQASWFALMPEARTPDLEIWRLSQPDHLAQTAFREKRAIDAKYRLKRFGHRTVPLGLDSPTIRISTIIYYRVAPSAFQ